MGKEGSLTMLKSVKISINLILVTFLAIAFAAVINISRANAQDSEQSQEQTAVPVNDKQPENSSEVFSYTAQPGDSHSLIARKAVQTFGIINKVNLSEAQIIFVETNLTLKAGSPELNEGQKVDISSDTIKEWTEKAGKLSQEQKDAWNIYAQNANFNTNSVGQAS